MIQPFTWPPVRTSSAPTTVTTDDVTNKSNVPVLDASLSSVLDTLYAPGNNAFITTPVTPDLFDLIASRMTDPDFSNNGWLVNDITTGTVLTRAGDIDHYGPRPPAFTYQSTLLGGLLFIRTPPGMTVGFSNLAQPGTTGYTLRSHVWVTKQTPNGTFTSNAYAFVWSAGTSGLINGPVTLNTAPQSQTTWIGCEDQHWILIGQTQGNFPVVNQQVDVVPPFTDLVNYMHVAPGPGLQGLKMDSGSAVGFLQPGVQFSTTATRLIDRAGFFGNSGPDGLLVLDSICRLPYLTFP